MTITGSCHCGKSAFRIEAEVPATLTRCTCSFCSKRGALWAYYQPAQFQLTTPATDDATYRWNNKLVAHRFCPVVRVRANGAVLDRRRHPVARGGAVDALVGADAGSREQQPALT